MVDQQVAYCTPVTFSPHPAGTVHALKLQLARSWIITSMMQGYPGMVPFGDDIREDLNAIMRNFLANQSPPPMKDGRVVIPPPPPVRPKPTSAQATAAAAKLLAGSAGWKPRPAAPPPGMAAAGPAPAEAAAGPAPAPMIRPIFKHPPPQKGKGKGTSGRTAACPHPPMYGGAPPSGRTSTGQGPPGTGAASSLAEGAAAAG